MWCCCCLCDGVAAASIGVAGPAIDVVIDAVVAAGNAVAATSFVVIVGARVDLVSFFL